MWFSIFNLINFMQNLTILRQQIKNRMSLQQKAKNIRVLSARVTHASTERSRPKSGIPGQTYTRRQMIETVYNSQASDLYRIQSARQPSSNIISQNFQNEKYAKKLNKQTRQKEQMASQILGLKQTVNRLVQELSHQKGKCQNIRKKSLKYQKILTMQFQDEKQWGSNAVNNHLVTGIKNMYDTLKEKYEAKCQEFDNFLKKQHVTKDLENHHYINVLQGEVKNLKKKIQKTNELNLASAFASQTQKQANEYVIADLQNEKNVLLQKNKQLEKKTKMMNQNIQQLQLKIQLDKKLIIEKDNNVHAFERKNKQLIKQIQKVKQLNLILDKQLAQMKQKYENESIKFKQYVTSSEQKIKIQVDAVSKSKDIRINSLQQDNGYLHKMIQQLRSTNLELNKANQQLREVNMKNLISKGVFDQKQFKRELNVNKNTNNQTKSSAVVNNIPYQNGRRIPQKADKKYHQNAIKTRKIQLMQVLQVAQLIRLKLIAQQYSIEKVKSLFEYKGQINSKQQEWRKEYITMAQVKQLFTKPPFNLEQQDSLILSRYLIEDVQEDYVYCDDSNENHRQVVKSIIKTLIQEYPVYSDGSPEYYEVNDTIEKYGKNLKSALKTVAKGNTVSKAKLMETMKSIGMDVHANIFQLILSKMAKNSSKLHSLDYTSVI